MSACGRGIYLVFLYHGQRRGWQISSLGLLHFDYCLSEAGHCLEVGILGVGSVGTCINIHLWKLVLCWACKYQLNLRLCQQ